MRASSLFLNEKMMNIEAERLITDAITEHAEIIIRRGVISPDSAKKCANEVIKSLKNLNAERAFLEVQPYSINYGRSELWKMFLNEILK